MADLPPKNSPVWADIAAGRINKSWDMLALKIMMTRISNDVKRDDSPANVQRCADEIYEFFEKNAALTQKDIASITG